MGRMLGLHDRVTCQTTELDGLHHMDTFVGCSSNDDDIEHRRAKKNEHPTACRCDVQVKHRQQWRIFSTRRATQPAAIQDRTNRNQDQADNKNHRQNQVGQNPEVWTAFEAP